MEPDTPAEVNGGRFETKLTKLFEASATGIEGPQLPSQTPLTTCDLGQMAPSERPFLTHKMVVVTVI